MIEPGPIRELTYEQRATWGKCPVCLAPHGERCNGVGSPQLGHSVNGGPIHQGVHLGRIQRAPIRVREVPA